jgi:hypothetical protein
MMRSRLIAYAAFVVLNSPGKLTAQDPAMAAPRVLEIDAATLAKVKARSDKGIIQHAIQDAEKALKTEPHSVTEKKQTRPAATSTTGTHRPATGGRTPRTRRAPYVRHDGVRNPEKDDFSDESNFHRTVRAADTLALAYYLTGNERYAAHAALLLRTWFLAQAMNPNLNFAQFVPNKNTGRPAGIVSARRMPEAIDAVGLLAGSKNWTAADDAGIKQWFARYYIWLTTSEAGQEQAGRPNNHGSWWQAQVAVIALYLGKTDDARKILSYVRDTRIPEQIDAKGLQKYEMVRTKSFSYSALNLYALSTMATVAQPLGIDLYQPSKPGAPGILTAVNALLPYDPEHPWPHEQIEKNREDSVCPALYAAVGYTHDAKYTDALKRFRCEATAKDEIIALGN